MKILYQVWYNEDGTEGRGRMIPLNAAFSSKPSAEKAAKNRGPMGASDGEIRLLAVYDSHEEYVKYHDIESVRQRALNKLSEEEKKVLGLYDFGSV